MIHTLKPARTYIILGASPFTGNKGVDALLSGTLESINHAADETIIVDYAKNAHEKTSHQTRHVCLKQLVALRFSWKPNLPNGIFRLLIKVLLCRALLSKRWQNSIFQNDPWLAPIFNASAAVAISGGDSFSDIYGFRRLLYISLPQALALALGKPLVILPQTIGPFKTIWARSLATFLLRSAREVYARDDESLEAAKMLIGGKGPCPKMSRDMAFALNPERPSNESLIDIPTHDSTSPVVAVNVSGLMMMGGYSRNNAFGTTCNYTKLIEELVKWLIKEKSCHVLLVSHVTKGAENDQDAAESIYNLLAPTSSGRLHLVDHTLNEAEIKFVIGQCAFLYGSRMHACIAALSQGIPAVGLSYSRKFKGVYETIGSESLVVELSGQGLDEIMAKCRDLFENRKTHKERLIPYAARAKSEALSLFSSLDLETKSRLDTTAII